MSIVDVSSFRWSFDDDHYEKANPSRYEQGGDHSIHGNDRTVQRNDRSVLNGHVTIGTGVMMSKWYVVDGIDGSGKSTVARILKEHLEREGGTVVLQVHPSDRWFGKATRTCLKEGGHEISSLNGVLHPRSPGIIGKAQEMERESSDHIIFVRYVLAASYLPDRLAPLGYRFLTKLLPVPHRRLLIDIDQRKALARIADRKDGVEMFENLESLVLMRKRMLDLSVDGWKTLENNGDEDDLLPELLDVLLEWDMDEGADVGRRHKNI